jgi:hypothetical protein
MSCRSFTSAVAFMVFITLLTGCGRKTALIPPQKLVPVKINDLGYVLDERGVTLKWSYPTKMENGDRLQTIDRFEIYRAGIPEEKYCPGCPVQYEEPVEIDGGRLPLAGDTRVAAYTDAREYLQSGYRYFYKVRSRAGGWYSSADSNVVSFVWTVPPRAPQGLEIEAGDNSLTLHWNPVTENIEAKPLEQPVLYQVYRKEGKEDFVPLGEPVREPQFVDTGLINAEHYSYKVRALVAYADALQAGAASVSISGVPRDLTAPPPPRDLVAVEIAGGVKLAWPAVAGDDLAGYRIYRREEKASVPDLLAEVGPGQNQYIDRSMTDGRKWFYSVTSFDTAQPANESQPSGEEVVDLR